MIVAWVLRTELRRGIAPLAFVGVAAIGVFTLFMSTEAWVGRWLDLASQLQVSLILVVPVCVTIGAWQGGRERRRRITELAAATPRVPWQAVAVRLAAVALAACAGLLVAWLVGALLVARVAGYWSLHGVWTWLLAFVSAAAAVAVGFAIGSVARWIVVAPVLGIVAYGLLALLTSSPGGVADLLPFREIPGGGRYVAAEGALAQMLWFAAVAITVVAVVTARRRWLAVVPAAVAGIAGWWIVDHGVDVVADNEALALSCVGDAPEVCVARQHAFLLDDLASDVRAATSAWSELDGMPSRLVDAATLDETDWSAPEDPMTLVVQLTTYVRWDGAWAGTGEWGAHFGNELAREVSQVAYEFCPDVAYEDSAVWDAESAAYTWAGGTPYDDDAMGRTSGQPGAGPLPPATLSLLDLPDPDQVTWINRWRDAAGSCDLDMIRSLRRELSS